jgi:hypothetical protein
MGWYMENDTPTLATKWWFIFGAKGDNKEKVRWSFLPYLWMKVLKNEDHANDIYMISIYI